MNRVRLRPITREDTCQVIAWRNSPEVRENLFDPRVITSQDHHAWLLTQVDTGKCHQFIIEAKDRPEGWRPIGSSFLKNMDKDKKTAEFGIFIGEASARGQGYGTAATYHTVDYGFSQLGLEEIYLYVFAENLPARKAYQKIGFVPDPQGPFLRPGGGARQVVKMTLRAPSADDT